VPPGLDSAAVAGVEGLDRVRRADHAADLHVVVQERNELVPGVVPQPNHCRVALSPFLGQIVECRPCRSSVDRGIDRFDITLDLISVLAAGEPKCVAYQMDNAGLHDGLRPHVADHLGKALQPVADDEENVLDPAVAQIGEHAHR
jgi:hypothetical protein